MFVCMYLNAGISDQWEGQVFSNCICAVHTVCSKKGKGRFSGFIRHCGFVRALCSAEDNYTFSLKCVGSLDSTKVWRGVGSVQ
jgi:hypothetical protein